MSTETPAPEVPQPAENDGGKTGTYTPPGSQADLDRIIADRLSRERAKFADYDDLKTKASEYDKVTEAQKTAEQKAAEALAEAQGKVQAYEKREQVATWKADVSKETGVPAAALAGSSLEEIQAHAETLKPLITQAQEPQAPLAPHVPSEGAPPSGGVASQLNANDIASMTPEQINAARKAGRLNRLMGIS